MSPGCCFRFVALLCLSATAADREESNAVDAAAGNSSDFPSVQPKLLIFYQIPENTTFLPRNSAEYDTASPLDSSGMPVVSSSNMMQPTANASVAHHDAPQSDGTNWLGELYQDVVRPSENRNQTDNYPFSVKPSVFLREILIPIAVVLLLITALALVALVRFRRRTSPERNYIVSKPHPIILPFEMSDMNPSNLPPASGGLVRTHPV